MDFAAEIRDFNDNGFVIVRQLLSRSEVAELEKQIQDYIEKIAPQLGPGEIYYEDSIYRPVKAMHGMHRHSSYFSELRNHEKLLDLIRKIWLDGEIIPESVSYFGKPAKDGSVTPPHQDNFFQHWSPPLAMTVTVSIDSSTPENGALICAKGSHREMFAHHPSDVMGFSMMLDGPVDINKYPEQHICLEPGDIALHHIAVIHRSEANRSDCSRRQLAIGYRSSLAIKDEAAAAKHRQMLQELHARHRAK